MNQFAVRTRNQNLLRSKTKGFKNNYQESQNRIKASSSLQNLAGKLYSSQYNQGFSPKKSRVVAKTPNQKSHRGGALNPELPLINTDMLIKSTMSMSGLSMRASHIPGFAEINTNLLIEKRDLEQRIMTLKQGIAHEKKLLNQADYNGKKNMNDNQKMANFHTEAHNKSQDLQNKINTTASQISCLKRENSELNRKINDKNQNVRRENEWCNNLDKEVKNLKLNLMQEQKERNHVKAELAKAQRVMESASIYCKELENQRATLLLSINQSVSLNKI